MIGRSEISLILFLILFPIFGVPPVSITAIDSEPIIKPTFAISHDVMVELACSSVSDLGCLHLPK